VMGVLAVLGLIAAGVIGYQRGLFSTDEVDVFGGGPDPLTPATNVDEYNPRTVVRPFPPITDAPVLKVNEVNGQVTDQELVLGVEVNGEARAYPINQLCGPDREIINDTLGNRAIAATW